MDENKKETTQEEAEQDFRENVFNIFAEKAPGAYRDENGFLVIPRVARRRKDSNPSDCSQE
ncbi:MAG: hypothetical protein E7298_07035 [Lachnospiraceae bacterium]|nr:hypothetical protein [Lachnospiraceae bacterium]